MQRSLFLRLVECRSPQAWLRRPFYPSRPNPYHVLVCHFASLSNRVGHFTSLAQTQTDSALLVTNYNQGAETEPPAAFDNLGRTVDENHFLRQFVGRFAFKKGGVA